MNALALRRCLCVLLIFQACGMHADTSDALPLGSHKVSVRPQCISKQIENRFPGKDKIYNLTCGATQVTIRNEELSVDGRVYGMLKEGDAVHVDGGKVFVNSEERGEIAPR